MGLVYMVFSLLIRLYTKIRICDALYLSPLLTKTYARNLSMHAVAYPGYGLRVLMHLKIINDYLGANHKR